MKKLAFIAIAALTMLAACTKDDSQSLAGTYWHFSGDDDGRKQTCSLTLEKNSGTLTITDRYSSHYTEWSDRWEYRVTSYTYDGEKSGTLQLRGASSYAQDNATASFTLNYNQSKMSISTPHGYFTMERIR